MKGILSSDYTNLKAGDKSNSSDSAYIKKIIFIAISAILGVILSNCSLFNVYSPFVAGFCCAVPLPYGISAGIGAFITSALGFSGAGLRGISAVIIILLIKWAMMPMKKINKNIGFNMACGFVVTFGAFVAFKGISNFNFVTGIYAFGEGAICVGAIYFFSYCSSGISKLKKISLIKNLENLSIKEKSGVVFTLLIVCMFFQSVNVYNINLCNVIFCAVILCFSFFAGVSGGCLSGVICGAIISVCNPSQMFLTACYSFSAMLSGGFKNMGKTIVATMFLLSNIIFLGITQSAENAIYPLFEIIFGACLFLIIPKKILPSNLIENIVFGNKEINEKTAFIISSEDIKSKAEAFKEVSKITKKLCEKMEKHISKEDSTVIYKVSDYLCKNCHKCDYCWQSGYSDTAEAFAKAQSRLEKCGKITKEDFPQSFLIRCHKSENFASITNFIYHEFYIKNTAKKQISTLKQSVWQNMQSFSDVLENSSKEISSYEKIDKKLTDKVLEILNSNFDLTVLFNAFVIKDKYSRYIIKIKTLKTEVDKNDFNRDLFEKGLSINLDQPFFEEIGDEIRITFRERAKFVCENAVTSFCFEEEKYCGDNTLKINLADGRDVFSISDGMGKGTNAAIDSAFCTKILSVLLKGDFDITSAMSVVNSSLMGKNTNETVTTLDISEIDLYTGYCKFYKAGACQSIIVKNGKVLIIEGKSMPMGLCEQGLYYNQDLKLGDGDLIIMFSDGMTGQSGSCEKLIPLVKSIKDFSCEKITKTLADFAKYKQHNKDDITVSAIRIKKAS